MDFRMDLVPARRKQVISGLMQLYLYDFTLFQNLDVNQDGVFPDYPGLDDYWKRGSGKYPFLMTNGNIPAGFALVDRLVDPEEGEFYMTEFFVMQKYRRSGMGSWAARELFDRFQGRWKVTQVKTNAPAQAFWRKVIGTYTDQQFEEKISPIHGHISQYFTSQKMNSIN
ncbi:GNAT family N-acetyltransferase [Paenibacillus dokdonensis]|uniref:GNAT family N-acetyltransferase n=1 Tax=Paenibacillus dokdonensis TaxID=2567944 RepID=A0ABU6GIM0_9BACL|nr:GNAT family N-acetyltransferase [Paenibacillus dokdonensis]MEC0239596.1 GNAT family N-acetyltransferase [Paenibacillus dokdonensis]